MPRTRALFPFLVALSGCAFNANGVGGGDLDGGQADGPITAIDAPLDTPDGGMPPVDAAAPVIDASPCVPSCTDPTHLDDCSGGPVIDCPLGCDDAAGVRCRTIVPSNGATSGHLAGVTGALVVDAATNDWHIDTDTGEITSDNYAVVVRGAGTGVIDGIGYWNLGGNVAVLAVSSLTVMDGARLFPEGTRALILLSAGDVQIHGVLDASAWCSDGTRTCGGPGAGDGSNPMSFASGCAPGGDGWSGSGPESGGGGGGFGEDGAAGGPTDTATGTGGTAAACTGPSVVPLEGGSGGGQGGSTNGTSGGNGGGGGGALQITSYTQIVVSDVVAGGPIVGVRSSGGGGRGGGGSNGGGGGGSGGALLLEAPVIVLANATVSANGGGGGEGNGAGNGTVGLFGDTSASGGNPGGATHGGTGGALFVGPGVGGGGAGVDGTGGGGGGVGIIRFNSGGGGPSMGGAVVISPAATTGAPASI